MINALDIVLYGTKFWGGDCKIAMVKNLCRKRIKGMCVYYTLYYK